MKKPQLIEVFGRLRDDIGNTDREVVAMKNNLQGANIEALDGVDVGETIANVTIAHRNLEDARMRLGKAIQSIEGGKSILDHPEVATLIKKIRATDA